MAVTITAAELVAALRLGDSAEEHAEVVRLRAYAAEAVEHHAPDASDTAHNEATRRLCGFLYDMPEAGRGMAYSNALRSSGAARMLLPYRIHRAGYAGAVAEAQAAVGTVGNPVTGLAVQGDQLVVTFEDGSTDALDLPAGQDPEDQTARDAAAAAQSGLEAHEASRHNIDLVAQSTALNARQVGEQAQTELETHRNSTHNHDATARTAARAAQTTANTARTELTAHEGTPHGGGDGTDQVARDAATAAQSEIDTHEAGAHNTDTTARSTARNARQTAEQAQTAVETHRNSTHNTDEGARTAAANAQSAIEDHGRTAHNTDTVARAAAATAQAKADAAALAAAAAIGGTPPTVLYEAAAAAIGGSTGLITGNVVCPESGTLELYFRQETGDRQGSIAFVRIPAADLRAAVSALGAGFDNDNVNVRILPLGANRGLSIAVQATTFYMMLSAQSTGNFNIRILHQG